MATSSPTCELDFYAARARGTKFAVEAKNHMPHYSKKAAVQVRYRMDRPLVSSQQAKRLDVTIAPMADEKRRNSRKTLKTAPIRILAAQTDNVTLM